MAHISRKTHKLHPSYISTYREKNSDGLFRTIRPRSRQRAFLALLGLTSVCCTREWHHPRGASPQRQVRCGSDPSGWRAYEDGHVIASGWVGVRFLWCWRWFGGGRLMSCHVRGCGITLHTAWPLWVSVWLRPSVAFDGWRFGVGICGRMLAGRRGGCLLVVLARSLSSISDNVALARGAAINRLAPVA